jgi:hypothetical protein
MKNREIFLRDPAETKLVNDGVAKVSEGTSQNEIRALRYELEHFVCEGQYRDGMVRILESYLGCANAAVQPAAWVSGFYGSGKSHLLKMLRHLWVDTTFPEWNGVSARGLVTLPNEVNDALKELDNLSKRCGGIHAASGTLPSGGGESVRLAVLAIILKSCGLPEALPQARFCLWLQKNGIYDEVKSFVESKDKQFMDELHDLYVSPLLADAILSTDPSFAADRKQARQAIRSQFPLVEDISTNEFIRTIREVLSNDSGIPCTIIVLDEIQLFIGDSPQRSTDVQEVAEALCKQLDSRVLLIGAGQTALAGSVPLLQRLSGRFTIPVELSDTDVETVTRRVVLAKKADKRQAVENMLALHAGEIDRQLSSSRISVCSDDKKVIVDDYPLLPVRRRFWEHVLRAVDIPGTASQLRTQLRIVYDAVRETAEKDLGTVLPADFVFEQIQADLLKSGILLREIDETIRTIDDGSAAGKLAKRLCGLIFLIRKLPRDPVADIGVRATPEMLADLMVADLSNDGSGLRAQIPEVLDNLVEKGVLIKLDEEYSLQTRESSEWDREFRNRKTKIQSDGSKLSSIRKELLDAACTEAVKGVKLLQGSSKEARRLVLCFGNDASEIKGHEIPVWIRDDWDEKESTVVADARGAGNDSPVIFVFIKKRSAEDLQRAIVDFSAAESTIGFKGTPSSEEGRDARNAMATRMSVAQQNRNLIIKTLIDEAKVFQGGGNESYGLTFSDKIKRVAEYSLDRLFPKFRDADDNRWYRVIGRAKDGDEAALHAIDWNDTPEKHPVCAAILSFIGSSAKGKDIRDEFENSPYGWPRDAIDAALLTLFTAGHIRVFHKGTVLVKGQLDQAKISVSDFQQESTTISVKDRISLRKLYQAVGIPCNPNEESTRALEFLKKLSGLAEKAGGDPPLPSRPNTADIEEIRGVAGNEQLIKIIEYGEDLQNCAVLWEEMSCRAEKRLPAWEQLKKLAEHARNLPQADIVFQQIEAVINERRLLEEQNPVAGIEKQLSEILRKEVSDCLNTFRKEFEKQDNLLTSNTAWAAISEEQGQAILQSEGITGIPSLSINTTNELLASLEDTSIADWRTKTAALPKLFANAAIAAAKLLEPEVQTCSLSSGTLKTEEDVKLWLRNTEEYLMDELKKGPIVIS